MINKYYLRSFKAVQYLYSIKINRFLYYVVRYSYSAARLLPLYVLRGIFTLMSRRKSLWLFGARGGFTFSDNTKYLFLYVQKECKDIDAIWITKNRTVVHDLRERQLPVYYAYSIKGIFFCLRAKIIFTTHGKGDINPTLTGGSIHIELYHFVIAFKKLRYDLFNYYPLFRKIELELLNPFIYFKPDYAISSSPFAAQKVISSLGLNQENVFLTGLPRTDAVLKETGEDRENIQKILGNQKYSHLIYYTPTFREDNQDFDYFSCGLNKDHLIDFLGKTDSVLILRFHPSDTLRMKKESESNITSHPRIIFENHDLSDPFSLLKQASVLITDYSGIYVDYLLMNRPIIFANFDHQGYVNARELDWNYDEITPGPKAENWEILLSHLENIIVHQKDEYQEARQKLMDKVYQYKDSNSCARIVKEIYRIV